MTLQMFDRDEHGFVHAPNGRMVLCDVCVGFPRSAIFWDGEFGQCQSCFHNFTGEQIDRIMRGQPSWVRYREEE